MKRCAWLLMALASGLSAPLWADDKDREGHAWLDRMSRAERELDYDGVFIYQQGDAIHSLRVVHAVRKGQEQERLAHLDGESREIIRRGHDITCIHPGDQQVRMDHEVPAGPFAQRFLADPAALEAAYDLVVNGKPERVAGHDAVEVDITPSDELRYGYRMVLDRETGLLLRSEIVDDAGHPLERFQFTSLAIGKVADADLQPALSGPGVASHHLVQDMARPHTAPLVETGWDVSWVPPDFKLAMAQVDRNLDGRSGVRLYTDGLAVFSVFVEDAADRHMPETVLQHGATVVYARLLEDQPGKQVTVVGEIPVLTARRVAASLRLPAPVPGH